MLSFEDVLHLFSKSYLTQSLALPSRRRCVSLLSVLKNSNAKLKGRDSDGKSLLHHCVENNAQGCLALLLERKSEVFLNVRDKDGWTPLHYSALLNNIPSAQQLITAGAHLDVVTPRAENGWSALHISVWLGFEEMAELLLTRGRVTDCHQGK